MTFHPYQTLAPAEVKKTIPELIRNDRVRKIGMPVLYFTADHKLLFTGNLEKGTLNLPSTKFAVHNPRQTVDLDLRVRRFSDYVFFDAGIMQKISYTGLMRQKLDEPAVVVPFTVVLGEESQSPYLTPSTSWNQNAVGNQDRVWACPDRVREAIAEGLLSENTATIVRFATQESSN